jgi:FkbM family methyltransferase
MSARRIRITCGFTLGDIVVLTGAVRELHEQYPGLFITDVDTSASEVWRHNPYITPIRGPAKVVDCNTVQIDRRGDSNRHYMAAYVDLLNRQLKTNITLRRVAGDIHLSEEEMNWHSDIWTLCKQEIPFWIICPGGKFDLPIKWWCHSRYQKVVDHFRGRIQFVQVGSWGNMHPQLEGAIDLRGQTRIRDLIHLVHYARGVLCGVTSIMHLAAAVPTENGRAREAVIIGGAREPEVWEKYPGHHYLGTAQMVSCGHCWKSRHLDLPDQLRRRKDILCPNVSDTLPRCMDLISAEAVIERIEGLIAKGTVAVLSHKARKAAERGIHASRLNTFDLHNVHLLNSVGQAERFIAEIRSYPSRRFSGKGIVICGGGVSYFTNAWVCINMLRHHGCNLPVELWHLGRSELDHEMERLVAPLGVRCVNAREVMNQHPMRNPLGWELKSYALLQSRFEEILLLDADNVAVRNPEFLFATKEYRETGAIFWPDYRRLGRRRPIWRLCGISHRDEPEFESGQMVVNKRLCWEPLNLAFWYNDHSEFFYQHIYGDKETFHLAWRKLDRLYSMIPFPIHPLKGTMCQHDFDGNRLFQHRNLAKWLLNGENARIEGFLHEDRCLDYLMKLRDLWDGTINGKSEILHRHGFQFRKGTSDWNIYESVAVQNEYRLPAVLHPDDAVLDVGGHIGSFAAACHARGSRSILCFEANAENAHLARLNLSRLDGVSVSNRAILHRAETVEIRPFPPDVTGVNTGGSSIFVDANGTIEAISLDEIVRSCGKVRLLKLDCEGSEWPILLYSKELGRVTEVCGEFHQMSEHELCRGVRSLDQKLLKQTLRKHFKRVVTVLDKTNPKLGKFWASIPNTTEENGSGFRRIARKVARKTAHAPCHAS